MQARLFIAYSHTDELLKDELIKHLSPLLRAGLILVWQDRRIEPGRDWKRAIDQRLETCHIILPLISADFISSDYCWGIEMQRALQRHESGEARLIPVILRPCHWQILPFAKYQVVPKDGRAVTTWSDRDEAYTGIPEQVERVARRSRTCNSAMLGQEGAPSEVPIGMLRQR
jgi:hypothetical protein